MPVAFKELGGSPVEQYTLSGFSAQRKFLIAWEDRETFAAEVLGVAATHGGSNWVQYPGKRNVFAVRLRYEPFDPDSPDVKAIPGLTQGLNSYSQSFAKATVEYITQSERDRRDGPENESGTYLTYKMTCQTETQVLRASHWTWEDNPSLPVPSDLELIKQIPVTIHELTWHQVVDPPWRAIDQTQGKINAASFLGCAPETLLFEGAEAYKLYRAGLEAGPSAFCWEIRYRFRQRAIKHGGAVYGWNHWYRDTPPGWVRLADGQGMLYEVADFSGLFRSEPAA